MLSDREREQLAGIEQALMAGDRRLAATFGPAAPRRQRRWPLRALFVLAVLLLVVGALASEVGLFLQGLACLAGWFGWRQWRTRTRPRAASAPADPPRDARRDGTPPGWFRPV